MKRFTQKDIVRRSRPNDAGCWEWQGTIDRHGYGRIRSSLAHRRSYALFVGPIAESLTVDHLCRNRRCVNPAHLEPVSKRENTLRGEGISAKNAKKTHCIRGHLLGGLNLRMNGRQRICKACDCIRSAAYNRRKVQP